MCPGGGSKGGMQPTEKSGAKHQQNTARDNAGEPQTGRKQPGGRNTHRAFLSAIWGKCESHKESRGNGYPCGKIKIL